MANAYGVTAGSVGGKTVEELATLHKTGVEHVMHLHHSKRDENSGSAEAL